MRYVVGIFLIFFAAIHGGYEKTPQPPGEPSWWRGEYGESWLLSRIGIPNSVVKIVGAILWLMPMIGLIAAGASVMGLIVPSGWWQTLAAASAAGSILLALLFWHPYQWISALVDAVILVVALGTNWPST